MIIFATSILSNVKKCVSYFQPTLLHLTDFAYATSHKIPSKYDLSFGTKISVLNRWWWEGGRGFGSEHAPLNKQTNKQTTSTIYKYNKSKDQGTDIR